MSITRAIMEFLANRDAARWCEIRDHVKTFYVSRTGHGQKFVDARTSEALVRLCYYTKVVERVSRGIYRLKKGAK